MYNANYMDEVPVKIAEKYKPPPAVYKLPQQLANKLNLEENYYRNCPVFSYDLQLEHKALSKIEQWKRIRQRNKELRIERTSKREQQRKREDEDRQKNLLYNVSYPSTDDLSSDEEEENMKVDPKCKENGRDIEKPKDTASQICVKETANSFHNILQPTVLTNNSSSSNNSNSTRTTLLKSTFEGKLLNSFNYKDFEDDTSSPFDNIELKTINDLDVLAQVLHNTQIKSTANETFNDNVAAASNDNLKQIPNNCQHEQQNSDSLTTENIPKPNNNLTKFNYDCNSTQGAIAQLRDHPKLSVSAMQYNANLPSLTVSSQQQYNELNNSNDYYSHGLNNYLSNNCNIQNANKIDVVTNDQVIKSKSVPDILKELRDEVRNSEIRRYRNCSYNLKEESTENIDDCLTINETITRVNDATKNRELLSHLDSKSKELVEQISSMGFPQQRVARIVQLVGADDKKVIEHLIPLSELADLGFDETKISDALIRNENNKNKALEDLIS